MKYRYMIDESLSVDSIQMRRSGIVGVRSSGAQPPNTWGDSELVAQAHERAYQPVVNVPLPSPRPSPIERGRNLSALFEQPVSIGCGDTACPLALG